MFTLREKDENIHPIADEPTWREAAYFDFYDPETKLAAVGYLGVHPNEGIGDQIFALWQGNALLAKFTRWDFNIPADIGQERFSFGPLHYYPHIPFKQCDWYYDDGYCRLDVTFHAIHEPYCWAQSHDSLTKTNSHHYEQQGVYMGVVRVGSREHKILGLGARDHAWGWGARAGVKRWVWASAQFYEKFAFNTFHITLGDDQEMLYGYVYRGGDNILLRQSNLEIAYRAKSKAPETLSMQLEDRDGNGLAAKGRILNCFDISHQERNKTGYHFFCFTQYECVGLTGYGQSNHHFLNDKHRPSSWHIEDRGAT